MNPEIFEQVAQGSATWYELRRGIPTASQFKCIMSKGVRGEASKTRGTYLRHLAVEQVTGEAYPESYFNGFFERGKIMEPKARAHYAFVTDADLRQVGFIRRKMPGGYYIGASPDSLVEASGILEIKAANPDLLVDCHLRGLPPKEHYPQLQGLLLASERDWIDLCVWFDRLPPFIHRTGRDDDYLKQLEDNLDRFHEDLEEAVACLEGKGCQRVTDQLKASIEELDELGDVNVFG
jgi:YqaJ-like viral recombinase domain